MSRSRWLLRAGWIQKLLAVRGRQKRGSAKFILRRKRNQAKRAVKRQKVHKPVSKALHNAMMRAQEWRINNGLEYPF